MDSLGRTRPVYASLDANHSIRGNPFLLVAISFWSDTPSIFAAASEKQVRRLWRLRIARCVLEGGQMVPVVTQGEDLFV
ncbi:hypothetical protein RRG08_033840 [Elysia crispata]|uniref:Uncharacterized protein n=1 Tax=Elysia crispata TaxID=231223 RepID=A0AAE1B8G8_9GAST|nr:hypothetical protein RRG08_033840 [Elysia crispata]